MGDSRKGVHSRAGLARRFDYILHSVNDDDQQQFTLEVPAAAVQTAAHPKTLEEASADSEA